MDRNQKLKSGGGTVRRRGSDSSLSDTSIQSYKRGKIDIPYKSVATMTSQENMVDLGADDELTAKIMEALVTILSTGCIFKGIMP